jgi:hypothetical protein
MGALQRALQACGARTVGVAETMLPMAAHLIGLAPTPPLMPAHAAYGSGPRAFDTTDSEILVPARPSAPARNPALMLPPAGRRGRRNVVIAAAVAFVMAALLTAIATNEPALAGAATQPPPAPARTSSVP